MTTRLATTELSWLTGTFALGPVRSTRWLARGAMGQVHRVETDAGRWAVKRAFWAERPFDEAQAAAEREVDLVARAARVGVRSPRPVPTRSGTVLAADDSGTVWRVHELAPGRPGDRSDVDAEAWALACGAAVHRLRVPPEPGESRDPFRSVVSVDWEGLRDRAAAAEVGWADALTRRAARLRELGDWAAAVPETDTVRCHGDLTAANTVTGADGTRWLVDWEDCGPQDPAREVGATLLHHLREEGTLGRLAAAYGTAYGAADAPAGGRGPADAWPLPPGAGLFASGVAAWLNFLAVQAEVLLDPEAGAGHHAFAQGAVPLLLEHLPEPLGLERAGRLAARAAHDAARTMGP